ncbi:MAG: hypothetical protein KatS3mg124_1622 [Porticoccaceae bacterium]|nr:MAG: hypothetical protein KatS3mg124_1622 [Porticoccaceae bacterium]
MSFLVLVAALLLSRHRAGEGAAALFARWRQVVGSLPAEGWRLPLLLFAGPAAVGAAGLACAVLGAPWLYWLLALGVLVTCLADPELHRRADAFLDDLRRRDLQAAWHEVQALGAGCAADWRELHAASLAQIAHRHLRARFCPFFWFALLGAPGALFYRLAAEAGEARPQDGRLAALVTFLEWLPVRLFGASLALVGNFGPVVAELRAAGWAKSTDAAVLAGRLVRAALSGSRAVDPGPEGEIAELEALPALLDRATLSWLALVALGVLAS